MNGRIGRALAVVVVGACLGVVSIGGVAAAGESGGAGHSEPLATLKVESPSVEVKKADADAFKKAKDGQKLREGDTVRTDGTGRAEIDYGGDAYTRLDVDTTFTVASLTDDQGNRQVEGSLEQGRTWNRTVSLTESESFEQSGGGATAAVTGTAFVVECESVDHCDFTAVVDITTLTGADGVQKLLTPLDQCDSTSGVLCGDITKISVDDLPQWITENLLRDLIERGLDDGGLRGTLVIEDDGTVSFVPESPPPTGVGGVTVTNPDPPGDPDDDPPPDTSTAPGAPTDVSALPGWESATVSWTPGDDGGSPVTTYTVTAIPVGPSTASAQTCPIAPPATSCTMTGLSNDTTYTFTVTATNKNGTSPVSAPSNAVTPPVVLPLGAVVQYTADDPGAGFAEPGFDDSGWQTGNGPFTQDTGGQDCLGHPSFPSGNEAFEVDGELWVRVTFQLPAGASNLQIVGTIDNVAEFFVNGESVGEVTGGNCDASFDPIAIPEHLLEEGTNVVAVHATDSGAQSFLDFTVQYTDPDTEETQVAATSGPGPTTTTSTTSTSTTTSTTTTTLPAPTEETTTTSTTAVPTE
jgi:hypothetical protein